MNINQRWPLSSELCTNQMYHLNVNLLFWDALDSSFSINLRALVTAFWHLVKYSLGKYLFLDLILSSNQIPDILYKIPLF